MGKIFKSENYLGERKKNYFEGWYFRHLGEYPCSFIVGVSKCTKHSHSFIQYIDCFKSAYFEYDVKDFSFNKKNMAIKILDNTFSLNGIIANLKTDSISINANLKYSDLNLFKKSVISPSVMGPFSYLPLPCNHALVSMSHKTFGMLEIDGNSIDYNGIGYIEKDFGTQFPKNYFWMHASNEDISIMTAVAKKAVLNLQGHLCVISYKGKQYNLSLYSLGKIKKMELTKDSIDFEIKKGKTSLAYKIHSNDNAMGLIAPDKDGNMSIHIKENLNATFEGKLILDGKEIDLKNLKTCAFESV